MPVPTVQVGCIVTLAVGGGGALTMISIVAGVAHRSVGVKVYVIVPVFAVLIAAGLQVPVKPLIEVVGNAGGVLFWQSGPIWVNAGAPGTGLTTREVAAETHPVAVSLTVTWYVPGARLANVAVGTYAVPLML